MLSQNQATHPSKHPNATMNYPPTTIHIPQDFVAYGEASSPQRHGRWADSTTKSSPGKKNDHAPKPTKRSNSSDKMNDTRWMAALPPPSTTVWSENNNNIERVKNKSFHSPMRPRRCLELRWNAVVDETPKTSPKKPGRNISFEDLRPYAATKPPTIRRRETTDPVRKKALRENYR
jgi:hypothetical protein